MSKRPVVLVHGLGQSHPTRYLVATNDGQLALKTFIAVDPDSRRDWFDSENSKNYPAYAGH